MNRKYRPVVDRQKALEPVPAEANFTLAGARAMYGGMGGKEFTCTIDGYCRTRIFEFPGIDFRPNGDDHHHTIYASPPVHACITANLVDYLFSSGHSKHYAISPSLQHEVRETAERIKSQQEGRVPVYLVVEENNQLTPVRMVKGECSISDQVIVEDGEDIPILVGGRKGEEFVTACPTVDGAWPELPNNLQVVNMILAAVRVGQGTTEPIRKYLDQNCLVTDDGRFVVIIRPTISARLSTATPMDNAAFRGRISDISKAITTMQRDIGTPHMTLLSNSMYSDEHKDDSYRRLQYLSLWQFASRGWEEVSGLPWNEH